MPNSPIEVDYNRDLTLLEDALFAVDRPGDYYVAERLELPPPTVKVDGIGTLSFPVPAFQVDRLIECAARAPYGRGEETIIDTTVRQVWQISADKVSVGGKFWERSFETIIGSVADGLGCERAQVSADLYKLLVYEPGGFFKPHRDTEKSEGMFGTLVLVLPSEHSGGELAIRHGNREARVNLSGSDLGELAFAALYADCEHQVLPLTSGHRICLVYNLVQPSVQGKNRLPEAPLYESESSRAASIVAESIDAFDPVKVVVPSLVLLGERDGARASRGAGFSGLWRHAAGFLLDRSEQPPERPRDWRQDVTVGCSCPDCRMLERFARNPQERIHRFAVRKDRRRHLHDAIKEGDFDMTHVTERKGSPHTLVCTKTRRGFERRLAQYRKDLAAMEALVGTPPDDVEPVAGKLAAALDRGERYE